MDDLTFEGDNNEDFLLDQAQDLDLFKYANNTKNLWLLPKVNPYHLAISILIGKNTAYDNQLKIMGFISSALGKREITKENWKFKIETQKKWGLSNEKIEGIKKILELEEVTPSSLCKIKEGGIYLVKTYKILSQEEDDVFLYDSPYILRNLGILFNRNKPMIKSEAIKISNTWYGYRSLISYFLYRIKSDSLIKILNDEELTSLDFLGNK